jgi:hypothetical protein
VVSKSLHWLALAIGICLRVIGEIKIDLRVISCIDGGGGLDGIDLAQDRDMWHAVVNC